MKKTALLIFTLLVAGQIYAAESAWLTDLSKAQAQAKAESKLVLLDFTGSDWCGWCIKMHKDTLDKSTFTEYAKKNLVLVEVDFPNSKPQSQALKKANAALQQQYKVDGYPTFVVLNGAGKEVWRQVGYLQGGPDAFVAELEKARKK